MTSRHIGYVTLVVRDYDEAKAWYCDVLGFSLIDDTPLVDGSPRLPWDVPAAGKSNNRRTGE
jgi:catechol 2,3-dioxygenase-like lactoylglutathione lyase family enzyme